MDKDIVFQCSKCEHLLFLQTITKEKLEKIMEMDCPNCGEEGYGNWVLLRTGNYEEEFENK